MRASGRFMAFIVLTAFALAGCASTPQSTLPEYRSSSLRSGSVVRARIPDGDAFRVQVSVENLSDRLLSFESADAAFIHVRTWYAANALRGTQIHIFAPVEDRRIDVPPRRTRSQDLTLAYVTGGAYITNLDTGQTTLAGGGLALSTLKRLELDPAYSL
ncbi:MAG: hypothetical protein R6W94_07380, partial [Spirochaetia bacterium]